MIAKAKLRFTRISPRKAREVANLIRGRHVGEAQDILINLKKKASSIILGLLNSALNNAKESEEKIDHLYINKIVVNRGPFLKRHRAEAFGRASVIQRKLSHIELELDREIAREKKTEKKAGKKTTKKSSEKKPTNKKKKEK
jgi:large subunit ribosomal protein L22